MAAKPVRFHEDADAEYENAFDWYLARSPHAAAEFAAELSRAVELIAQAPRRWAPGLGGTRRFLLRRFPFALVYRELPSLAVAHNHRRPRGVWNVSTAHIRTA